MKIPVKWRGVHVINEARLYDSWWCCHCCSNVLIELTLRSTLTVEVFPCVFLLVLSCFWRSRVSPGARLRGHLDSGCVSTCSGSSSTYSCWLCWAEPSTSSTSPPKHRRTWWDCVADFSPPCPGCGEYIHTLSLSCVSQIGHHWLVSLVLEYLPPIAISFVNLLLPQIFRKISSFEDYSFTMQVNATLVR